MRNPTPLRRAARRHRVRLGLTYLLFVVETAAGLLHPLALGAAVGGLVSGSFAGVVLLGVQQAAAAGLGVGRRLWDTAFFPRLAAELAAEMALAQRAAGVDVSAVAARVQLVDRLVEFFERDVPLAFHGLCQAAGAFVLLGLMAPALTLPAALLLLPAAVLGRRYGRAAAAGTRALHDRLEETVGVLAARDAAGVVEHLEALSACRRRLCRAETIYFGSWQAIGLGFLAAVSAAGAGSGWGAAEWTAVLGYGQMFLVALVNLPALIDQVARLRDVSRRLAGDAPDRP